MDAHRVRRAALLVSVLLATVGCGDRSSAERGADSSAAARGVSDTGSSMGDSQREKYEGDLDRTLVYYSMHPDEFLDKYGPVELNGKGKHYKKNANLRRVCAGNVDCLADAFAMKDAHKVKLDKIGTNGTVVGFFRITTPGAVDGQYKLLDETGVFLIAFPRSTGVDEDFGEWQQVKVVTMGDGTKKMEFFPKPGTTRLMFERCHKKHFPDGDLAGFESCDLKHSVIDSLARERGAAAAAATDTVRGRFTVEELADRLKKAADADWGNLRLNGELFMWVTCHAGCCRART